MGWPTIYHQSGNRFSSFSEDNFLAFLNAINQ